MFKPRFAQPLFVAVLISAAMNLAFAQVNPPSLDLSYSQQNAVVQEVVVNVSNIANNDERGAESNIIREIYVGAGLFVTTLQWNINLTSYAGSYLSEMQLSFTDSSGFGVTFSPADGDDMSGTQNYVGFHQLDPQEELFQLGADGILRLEFHDGYKDLAFDEPEGMWNSGTLTFGVSAVPEPQTYALLLAGLLLVSRAARRRLL